jgi:phospholipid/cholesterol/gamma-HCH transport system substrate-binding protein
MMRTSIRSTRTRSRLTALVTALALSTALAGCSPFGGDSKRHFSADFDRVIGVYVHSDVRVLGVKIGQVTQLKTVGKKVHLEMEYDDSYKIPKDVTAVVLAPSIVSDRYVQLSPVYSSGATLPDHAHVDQTLVPVELDQVYKNIDNLDLALGPDGANKNGALSDLLKVSAANLDGNGAALHGTLDGLSKAVETLANSRGDLFATITNLQQFTTVLAQNDSTVRAFNSTLANVAAQLNGERTDLATAVKTLSSALAQVATFVQENKDDLTFNVKNLASVTTVLVKQKRALKEFIDTAPTALSNLQLAYNPKSGTLDTRADNTTMGPAFLLCSLFSAVPGALPASAATLCKTATGGLPGLGGASPSSFTAPGQASTPATRDMTLGGILEASS